MQKLSRTGDVEVGSDLVFEQRWWGIQKTAWGTMVLLVLAGLAGVFGRGPLSKATAQAQGEGAPLRIQYERFPRFKTPTALEVYVDQPAIASCQARVRLSGQMMNALRIQRVIPEPISTEPLPDGAIFTFQMSPSSDAAEGAHSELGREAGWLVGSLVHEFVFSNLPTENQNSLQAPPTTACAPAKIVFAQEGGAVGLVSGEVALEGTSPIRLKQFIYP